jgi:hypothetical protein
MSPQTFPSIGFILDSLQNYLSRSLQTGSLNLDKSQADGRLNSQMNERQISDALRLYGLANEQFQAAGCTIEIAPPRFWYDFLVSGPGIYLPVNIKVSSLEGNDNLSSKEGVFFALTGTDPKSVKINDWDRYCESIGSHLGTNPEADYYFLVINKTKLGDVFWTSLKRLPDLTPNGNNPPFQCNWSKNRDHAERSLKESEEYTLTKLRQTFALRAKALESFDCHIQFKKE